LPSRSTTQAFCCGTILNVRMMKMTAMMARTTAISMGTSTPAAIHQSVDALQSMPRSSFHVPGQV
jgi:hypothetical protein